ncbi:MAG: hypothetical protein HZB95_08830 [Nitrosomonadales bacterium]|nr:hypothetical protein [Nitrosomonadales bacterium]
MELLFKLILSVVVVMVCFIGLRWIWTHQLDLRDTIGKASDKVIAPPDWVATRDPMKIYQGGNVVGDVTGPVNQQGTTYSFSQLINTSSFDTTKPFEYQRAKLSVTRINISIGMKSDGRQVLTGVLEGVECQTIN